MTKSTYDFRPSTLQHLIYLAGRRYKSDSHGRQLLGVSVVPPDLYQTVCEIFLSHMANMSVFPKLN